MEWHRVRQDYGRKRHLRIHFVNLKPDRGGVNQTYLGDIRCGDGLGFISVFSEEFLKVGFL